MKKYHYFYKITNLLNNHFYYGVHNTNDIEDGYMGSGKRLQYAYKIYGIENFKKEILKYFNSAEEAFKYESEIVTEGLVKNEECYNLINGGKTFDTTGMVSVRDEKGNTFLVNRDDKRYINKELVSVNSGFCRVKDNNGNIITITTKEREENPGKYHGIAENKVTVKDTNGKFYCVDINDKRYISGKLTFIWKGRKHKQSTIEKQKETFKKTKHQQGEKNSQYGTCWINKDGINKKVKKEEIEKYIISGWSKGRIITSEPRKNKQGSVIKE